MNKADTKTYDKVNGPWWMYAYDEDQLGKRPYEKPEYIAYKLLVPSQLADTWYNGFSVASHVTNAVVSSAFCGTLLALDSFIGSYSIIVALGTQSITSDIRGEDMHRKRISAMRVEYARYAASRMGADHQHGLSHAIFAGVWNGIKRNTVTFAASHCATVGTIALRSGAYAAALFKNAANSLMGRKAAKVSPNKYATALSDKAIDLAKVIFVRRRTHSDKAMKDVESIAQRALEKRAFNLRAEATP